MKNGVYRIRHEISGKCYIGSAADPKGIKQRFAVHRSRLDHNNHHSRYLQHAWNKYGADAFVFEVLLYCDPEDCLTFEQIAIDCYQPKYNSCPNAHNSLGYRHSDATKEKMKQNHADVSGHKNPNYGGRSVTPEWRYKQMLSTATKLSISDVNTIRQLLQQGMKQKEIADKFGVARQTISDIKCGRRWSAL